MNQLTDKIQDFFESQAFGVCTHLGEKLGVATSSIRLFFIYTSFITFGILGNGCLSHDPIKGLSSVQRTR